MLKQIQKYLYMNSIVYLFFREIFKPIVGYFKLAIFKCRWRKKNKHNFTDAQNIYPLNVVSVGKETYGSLRVLYFSNPNEKLKIGSYCSIGGDVVFVLGGNHPLELLSTYPFAKHFHKPEQKIEDKSTKGPINIGSDVWIGHGVIILSGVTIGQGAVIGAGSVVSKDVPPYSIYLGNRVVKYRFSQEIIDELIKIDYDKITRDQLFEIEPLMYQTVTKDTAEFICETILKSTELEETK